MWINIGHFKQKLFILKFICFFCFLFFFFVFLQKLSTFQAVIHPQVIQDGPIIFQKLQRKALFHSMRSFLIKGQKLAQVQTLLMQNKLLRRGLRFLDFQARNFVRNMVSSLLKWKSPQMEKARGKKRLLVCLVWNENVVWLL